MEEKMIGLYASGMSQRDIAEQIKELYDVEISPDLVTKITEKIMTAMKEMFRDVLQTVMEAEMDEELGRERCQSAETSGCPGIGTGASSRRSSENTAGTRTVWKRR